MRVPRGRYRWAAVPAAVALLAVVGYAVVGCGPSRPAAPLAHFVDAGASPTDPGVASASSSPSASPSPRASASPSRAPLPAGPGLRGSPNGIPITYVAPGQAKVPVSFDYAEDSDRGPYPIPRDALVEGGRNSSGDRHVLVVDTGTCKLYEMWDSHPAADGSWHAGSGAVFDLRGNVLRPAGLTSADAAGLPVVPGLVR